MLHIVPVINCLVNVKIYGLILIYGQGAVIVPFCVSRSDSTEKFVQNRYKLQFVLKKTKRKRKILSFSKGRKAFFSGGYYLLLF